MPMPHFSGTVSARANGELFLFKLRAFTDELIRVGVDIDTMSNQDFQIFMAGKISSWVKDSSFNF